MITGKDLQIEAMVDFQWAKLTTEERVELRRRLDRWMKLGDYATAIIIGIAILSFTNFLIPNHPLQNVMWVLILGELIYILTRPRYIEKSWRVMAEIISERPETQEETNA